jgi:glycosyltransferase involved in cell wall biosynthesis
MRWFTCTPVAFGGGPDFFARDSGLLSRGFQAIGVDSRAVMPGEPAADDEPDLIRTAYADLESPEWWRGHGLDGVVLYAWGRPKFRRVAEAIRQAGIFLVLNQDSGGVISPLNGLSEWWREERVVTGGGLPFLKRIVRGLTMGLAVTDPLRARHLRHGDVISCVSPAAVEHYRRLCRIYGGDALAAKVRLLPHPVHPLFQPDGGERSRAVVTVGRWDAAVQKRPDLMMAVVSRLVSEDAGVTVEIVGTPTPPLSAWHAALADEAKCRVRLHGRLAPAEIGRLMARARVAWCPSAFESFHIASGEALCSGCSVVAAESPSLASFPWFVSERSGSLARTDDVAGHAAAIIRELRAWDDGRREARAIAATWQARLQAPEVARLVISIAAGSGMASL